MGSRKLRMHVGVSPDFPPLQRLTFVTLYAAKKLSPALHEAPPFIRVERVSKESQEYEQIVLDDLQFAYVEDYGSIGRQFKAEELVVGTNRETFRQTIYDSSNATEEKEWEEIVRRRLRKNTFRRFDDLELWIWTWTDEARRKVDKRLSRYLDSTRRVYWDTKTAS